MSLKSRRPTGLGHNRGPAWLPRYSVPPNAICRDPSTCAVGHDIGQAANEGLGPYFRADNPALH
jgi:hypothetical protein